MLTFLSWSFLLAGLISAYIIIIRPILRERGAFKDFYDRADTFWQAVNDYTCGFRTKIAAWLIMLPSALVGIYDFVVPLMTGIDFAPITTSVPAWAWPFILLAIGALFRWLRKITDGPEATS